MIYLISDTHFNHKNIIKYANRPFDNVEEMNKHMIKQWNKVVSNKDTVYHLGDFGWGNKEEITRLVSQLNGNKILIRGNHDAHSSKWYMECGFNMAIKGGIILEDYYLLTHKPIHINELSPFVNIHGHLHQHNMEGDWYLNVSVEQIDYTPILFDEIKKKFKEELN